jgi:mxaJ protein
VNTRPYYRSSYAFVTRAADRLRLRALDDPPLRRLRLGVQLVGDDGWNSPPAHALAARHIVSNVVGYSVYGDYLQANPPARIVDAVAARDIDVAIAWGPLAGYFAARSPVPLAVVPVTPQVDPASELPLAFDISVGVSKRQRALRDQIDVVLVRRRAAVRKLLDDYHVPRVPRG